MKRIKLSPILFWLVFLAAASPQQKGVVEGRLVNGTDPSIVARSVELDVVELGAGMNIIKTAITDSSGKFRVEGVPGTGRLMIRAIYKDVNYHSQFSMDASGKAYVEVEVFEPTASMEGIQVEGARIAFQIVGDQLQSLETITFKNKTKPPRTLMNPEGNFRFAKASGITELPQVRVTAPGSSMPLVQAPLESPDGQSYYSLYPLKPGITMFEVRQALPYANRKYIFARKAYQDIASIDIGISPMDMTLSGEGLSKVSTDSQQNFAVYRSGPIKAGSEIKWTFSGGTAASAPTASESAEDTRIEKMHDVIGRNARVIVLLLLMGFILVLWYAFNQMQKASDKTANPRMRELKDRRDQLLNTIADLDHRYDINALGRQEYLRQREENKRRLRRISLLLKM
jgi:cbb3-type cytochrome oxidase subunit 3